MKDGEPCSHPGCAHHVSHPCEGSWRVAARSKNMKIAIMRSGDEPTRMEKMIREALPDAEFVVCKPNDQLLGQQREWVVVDEVGDLTKEGR